jgi:hypothetical protein
MPARVLSSALSGKATQSATADVNGIDLSAIVSTTAEAFPVEVDLKSEWGDTAVVIPPS